MKDYVKMHLSEGIRDHAGYEHDTLALGGGKQYYVKQGWIPERIQAKGGHKDGCAQTLEYAYQDWCLAQLAKNLGKEMIMNYSWIDRRIINMYGIRSLVICILVKRMVVFVRIFSIT